jgi:hypothetical protein
VVGVVAAIGVGGVLLRSATEGEGVRPAGPSSTAPPVPTTTQAPTTPAIPGSTVQLPTEVTTTLEIPSSRPAPPGFALLPGWSWVDAPMTQSGPYCNGGLDHGPEPQLGLPDQKTVTDAFLGGVRKQSGMEPTLVQQSWQNDDPEAAAPRGYVEVNVDMGDGPGAVQLEVGRFGGTPREAADTDVATYGNCQPPSRLVRPDGTVLQLYPPDFAQRELPLQHLAVYLPNGRQYIVSTAGYGESDKTPVIGDGSYTVTSGRGRLPFGDAELASVGEALADIG